MKKDKEWSPVVPELAEPICVPVQRHLPLGTGAHSRHHAEVHYHCRIPHPGDHHVLRAEVVVAKSLPQTTSKQTKNPEEALN